MLAMESVLRLERFPRLFRNTTGLDDRVLN